MKKSLFAWLVIALFIVGLSLTSCNVTRTVTTTSQTYQRGDTAVMIQTKMVESYDATRKVNN